MPSRRIGAACLTFFALLLATVAGCQVPALPQLNDSDARWVAYANTELGYEFDYPELLEPSVEGAEVQLRSQGRINARVVFVDRAEMDRRGLWGGSPSDELARMGGRQALIYRHEHWDGPLYAPTVAYVVPHRDRYLGLEFRLGGMSAEARERIVESFRFTER